MFYVTHIDKSDFEAEKFDTLEEAAHYILAYDVRQSDIESADDDDGRGEYYVPWVQKMDGRIVRWTACASYDLEQVYWNIADKASSYLTLTDRDQHVAAMAETLRDAYATR